MDEKKIEVLFFSILREQAACSETTVNTKANTALELYGELTSLYSLNVPPETLLVAVNEEYMGMDGTIKDGDCVVFLPPVAGG